MGTFLLLFYFPLIFYLDFDLFNVLEQLLRKIRDYCLGTESNKFIYVVSTLDIRFLSTFAYSYYILALRLAISIW